MANLIKNITYPFYLKENDFKEEHNKAFVIKKWLDENGQELAEYILRHQNHYALNGYKDVLLKDFPSAITRNNLVFKPIKELVIVNCTMKYSTFYTNENLIFKLNS